MSDQNAKEQPGKGQLKWGMKIDHFVPGSKRTPFSAMAMWPIVALCNAMLSLKVVRRPADPNADGSFTATGKLSISALNAILELSDLPAGTAGTPGASVQLMQVVSDPGGTYITAKLCSATGGVFTATGSALNVAKPFLIRSVATLDQPYTAGVHILATQPIGGTGVTVSSVDVVWEDLNVDARRAVVSGVRYRGTYSAGTVYSYGDIVQVFTGTSQGTYICVAGSPITGTAPVFPTAGSWDLFAFGVQTTTVCDSGSKTMYLNATPPV